MSPRGRDQGGRPRLLVVDDEADAREGLARIVAGWGYEVETAASAEAALELVDEYRPDVVITDLVLPEMDGLKLLERMREAARPPVVLLLTGHASVETAVEAMRRGAADFLTKPVEVAQLQVRLEKAIARAALGREVDLLLHQLRDSGRFGQLAGQSPAMQEVYRWIELAASSTAPVLILGESGTGKELVARTIHEHSSRAGGPFVTVNCAAIPETLIESEIFGHERGAFTGASERRLGCFELACGGSLFLDEIAEMDVLMQAKLLRVLQGASFRRLGGKSEIVADARIIAATNRDPAEALASGKLREDLLYRINVFTIQLPPLRERVDDIQHLVRLLIEEFNARENRSVKGPTPMEDAPVMSLREMERLLIVRALDAFDYDKPRAAATLGISLKTLYNKLAKYGIPLAKPER